MRLAPTSMPKTRAVPRGRRVEPEQRVDERRLAGAVGTEQADGPAGERAGETVQDGPVGEPDRQFVEFNDRFRIHQDWDCTGRRNAGALAGCGRPAPNPRSCSSRSPKNVPALANSMRSCSPYASTRLGPAAAIELRCSGVRAAI